MDAGRQWYLHAIYTVRSAASAGRGIGKRSVEEHHTIFTPQRANNKLLDYSRTKRDTKDIARLDTRQILSEEEETAVDFRTKRDESDIEGVGEGGKGTNIARVQLDLAVRRLGGDVSIGTNIESTTEVPLVPVIISILLVLIVCIILIIFLVLRRRRKKRQSPPPTPAQQTITVVQNGQHSNGLKVKSAVTTKLLVNGHCNDGDNTEV